MDRVEGDASAPALVAKKLRDPIEGSTPSDRAACGNYWGRADHASDAKMKQNETSDILICGTKNDRTVRYSLGRTTSSMAVARRIRLPWKGKQEGSVTLHPSAPLARPFTWPGRADADPVDRTAG